MFLDGSKRYLCLFLYSSGEKMYSTRSSMLFLLFFIHLIVGFKKFIIHFFVPFDRQRQLEEDIKPASFISFDVFQQLRGVFAPFFLPLYFIPCTCAQELSSVIVVINTN